MSNVKGLAKPGSQQELVARVMKLPPNRRRIVIETALLAVQNHFLNEAIRDGTARPN